MNETELTRDLRRRRASAYELLTRQYGRLLWTIAAGILHGVGTPEDVEEIVADVFVELWQKPEQFDPERSSLRTFLCVKARSRAIDRLRSLCRHGETPMDEVPEPYVEDVQQQLLQSCTVERVLAVLNGLTPPDREILTLRLVYELKPADIAAKLNIPVTQVYERIRKGKAQLIAVLRQEGYYE